MTCAQQLCCLGTCKDVVVGAFVNPIVLMGNTLVKYLQN